MLKLRILTFINKQEIGTHRKYLKKFRMNIFETTTSTDSILNSQQDYRKASIMSPELIVRPPGHRFYRWFLPDTLSRRQYVSTPGPTGRHPGRMKCPH